MKFILEKKVYLYSIILSLGLLTSFTLPPYNFYILNFLIFPSLIYILIVHNSDKFKFFLIGWIFGFGYFISSLYWIANSLTFDERFKFIVPFAIILIPTFLGLFYGLSFFLISFFNLKKKFSTILIFSIIFTLVEFLRSFILGGFPWNLIVFSLSNHLPSIQILSNIGTYSLNLLSITIFLFPSIIFFQYKKFEKFLIFFFGITLVLVNIEYGKYSLRKFEDKNYENLNLVIRILSPQIPIERFLAVQDPKKSILELIELSNPDFSKETIFIFPEGIITSIYSSDLKSFKKLFKENYYDNHKIILGINSVMDDKIFNSLVLINNNGELLYEYNKNKLVPFGEFIPFEKFFKKIGLKKVTKGYHSFSSDKKREILNINNLKFLPLICYEIIYSGKINLHNENYDFLLNISEDGWFGKSIGPKQHFSHSIFRSIEEGKNTIRSTNNGISAFITPKGQIINKIDYKGYIDLNKFKRVDKTYFAKNGNKIFFYFILFYTILILILKIRENR